MGQRSFTLFYQPRIDIKTSKVSSCEALIRLRDGKKIISPAEFLPDAEKDGSIIEIDRWVMRQVVEDARRIFTGIFEENIGISFNISPLHFSRDDFFEGLMDIKRHTGDFKPRFEVEITETALITDIEKARSIIERLVEEGFGFAIDDFGTGYGALTYLKDFSVHTLKIDRSFISQILNDKKARAIVDAVIYLADKIRIKTTAEGVERVDEVELLSRMGCHEIQGFLYSRPLSLKDFILFVHSANKPVRKDNFIRWSDEYATHLTAFDSHHMILVNLLNRLYNVLQDEDARQEGSLKDYTGIVEYFISVHFVVEERAMAKYDYPKIKEHILEHRRFNKLFHGLKGNLSDINERNIFDLFNLLKDWFKKHEIKSDKEFANFVRGKLRSQLHQ